MQNIRGNTSPATSATHGHIIHLRHQHQGSYMKKPAKSCSRTSFLSTHTPDSHTTYLHTNACRSSNKRNGHRQKAACSATGVAPHNHKINTKDNEIAARRQDKTGGNEGSMTHAANRNHTGTAFHKTLVHTMHIKNTLRHMPHKCQTSYMFDDTNAANPHKPSPHSLHSFKGHQRY